MHSLTQGILISWWLLTVLMGQGKNDQWIIQTMNGGEYRGIELRFISEHSILLQTGSQQKTFSTRNLIKIIHMKEAGIRILDVERISKKNRAEEIQLFINNSHPELSADTIDPTHRIQGLILVGTIILVMFVGMLGWWIQRRRLHAPANLDQVEGADEMVSTMRYWAQRHREEIRDLEKEMKSG